MKKLILPVLIIGLAGAGAYYFWQQRSSSTSNAPDYRTDQIERGDIVEQISATGTIEPEELVDVGAQVSGMISTFGKDLDNKEVDYGSQVKSGMVLARIDDSLYTASLRQAQAQLLQANANLKSAEAQLLQQKAKLQLASNNYERAKTLRPNKVITQTEYDTALSDLEVANANVAAAEASIAQCQASIASAQAGCDSAQRNLDYCTIKSPVDGVIIDRCVNIGQTVVSSMSASSLFLIAKDLKKMQIWVSVNEADIGNIAVGQKVTFTVETFPGRQFKGVVRKIRLNATMSQNVVTYVVEVETDNSDGKLLPYLTAGVNFIIAERRNVMRIPNTALRFRPAAETVAPEQQELLAKLSASRAGRRSGKAAGQTGAVWIKNGAGIRGIEVKTGLSDGIYTELVAGELPENAEVITADLGKNKSAAATGSTNPFLPKPPQRRR